MTDAEWEILRQVAALSTGLRPSVKICLVDVYANHGVLAMGSGTTIDVDLDLGGDAVVSSPSHVLVATRGQAGLVRVGLWQDAGPRVGVPILASRIVLQDQYFTIFDLEKIGIHQFTIGPPGDYSMQVMVDDPGMASRIDVVFAEDVRYQQLSSLPGHPPFEIVASSRVDIGPSDELSLILSAHDMPFNRLAAAIKNVVTMRQVTNAAVQSFWIGLIVEWVRPGSASKRLTIV